MGITARLKDIFGAKVEKGIEALEDPKEMLDYSLVKMEDGLQAMQKNAAEFSTAKKRLELQRDALRESSKKYAEQAEKALELGQEDLAKEALLRKAEAAQQETELNAQIEKMGEQLQTIARGQEELRRKIQQFRSKKEELKATYEASRAQLKVKELVTSLGSESENIGRTVERAQARIEEMQARVQAIDELEEEGLVTDVLDNGQDEIDRKLKRVSMESAVDEELGRLKANRAANS
ncbi:phage shock protein A [Peptococcaceae bacterium CEB3]|nr:phage shock protein A [Peptococcaceae bacterium CEB3]